MKESVGPVGSKFEVVNRIIIGRSETDMGNVKEEFYKKYNEHVDVFLKVRYSNGFVLTTKYLTVAFTLLLLQHFLEGYYWDLMVLLAGFEPQFFTT